MRPVVSGRPMMRFMFWMACPAAPFTILSIAPIITMRLVLGSILKFTSAKLLPSTACLRNYVLVQNTYKIFILIILVVSGSYLFPGHFFCKGSISSYQDASVHWNQMRGEADHNRLSCCIGQLLFDLRCMSVGSYAICLIFSLTSQKRLSTFALLPAPEVPDFASMIMVFGSMRPSFTKG